MVDADQSLFEWKCVLGKDQIQIDGEAPRMAARLRLEMPEDAIAGTLDTQYLSRDPSPSKRAAYIQRTMAKARSWAQR